MKRWIAIAALAAACGKGDGKGKAGVSMDDLREAKVKEAKLQVARLAFEAYGQWAGQNPSKACPDALSELTPYLDRPDLSDPWGNPYEMKCDPGAKGAGVFRVLSAGPDGKIGTDDDLASDQR
jgi:hypothetical protein